MKKVRFDCFETPITAENFVMSDSECHSPRPFIEGTLRTNTAQPCYDFPRVLPYNSDPVQRYDCANSSPYPSVNKIITSVPLSSQTEQIPSWKPSDDLDLSLLDASSCEPRPQAFSKSTLKNTFENRMGAFNVEELRKPQVLSSIDNSPVPPNVLVKDNSFFIRRDNLDKYYLNANPLHSQYKGLNINKENNPSATKADMMKKHAIQQVPISPCNSELPLKPVMKVSSQTEHPKYTKLVEDHCRCHNCIEALETKPKTYPVHHLQAPPSNFNQEQMNVQNPGQIHCHCLPLPKGCTHCVQIQPMPCACSNVPAQNNAVDKKTWAIEKFEQKKQSQCLEVEKQTNTSKEKREPTVADLFKIIKLQNEQLQLLQDKVDKFISASQQNTPTISCSTEQVSISGNNQMKMSIGVMTSFEMVRTSTVINKEVLKQTNENQIQCNRSQISIKEVVSKPTNQNFLDGIIPVNSPRECKQMENGMDKTLNELSLYNVQVDNATTPNISPEQTLYLDVRDYSESDASCNDQSNVGWTYYNKVMTHVNGMLQDSEMPSSASAMFRNMRQQCVQMQIDKSNVSVTKRVKFGDDPHGIHQPHLYATDTSLKMNQLAAKYLNAPVTAPSKTTPKPNIDMSFATRNYMERHKLIQGVPSTSKSPQGNEIPRFLDITALKQQPKFL